MAKRFGTPRDTSNNSAPSSVVPERRGKKTKIALRIPSQLAHDVSQAIVRDQYSPKKKSLWVQEALHAMARHDADMSESLVGDKAQGRNDKQMVVAFSTGGCEQLKDSMVRLRLQLPTIEGVQSLVLRCAMRFRIRHPEFFIGAE